MGDRRSDTSYSGDETSVKEASVGMKAEAKPSNNARPLLSLPSYAETKKECKASKGQLQRRRVKTRRKELSVTKKARDREGKTDI
jgi:hypothetical protein